MRVGVLYQMPKRAKGLALHRLNSIQKQVNEVKKALLELGHRPFVMKIVPSGFTKLREKKLNAIINLCQDHVRQKGYLEPHVSAMLDLLEVPYTGSNYLTIATSLDKIRSKELLTYHEIPTPKFTIISRPEKPFFKPFQGRVFIKPAYQDGSVGIDQASLAETDKQYRDKLISLGRQFKEPIIVEQYLPGREFVVQILGNRKQETLPVAERLFLGGVPFVTAESAWNPHSAQFAPTLQCPADIDATFKKRLERIALKAYKVLNCKDYAKIDIRCNAQGKPFILDVNPHQDISEGSELSVMWQQTGRKYSQLIEKLLALAHEQKKQ